MYAHGEEEDCDDCEVQREEVDAEFSRVVVLVYGEGDVWHCYLCVGGRERHGFLVMGMVMVKGEDEGSLTGRKNWTV